MRLLTLWRVLITVEHDPRLTLNGDHAKTAETRMNTGGPAGI
jgi:hypothetical protein